MAAVCTFYSSLQVAKQRHPKSVGYKQIRAQCLTAEMRCDKVEVGISMRAWHIYILYIIQVCCVEGFTNIQQ